MRGGIVPIVRKQVRYNVGMAGVVRFLTGILVVVSLMLCVSAGVFWMRSYRVAESIAYGRNGYAEDTSLIRRFAKVQSSRGRVMAGWGHFSSLLFRSAGIDEGFTLSQDSTRPPPTSQALVWSWLGFEYWRTDAPGLLVTRAFSVPHWGLVVAFGIAPVLRALQRWRLKGRVRGNLCLNCGYDLRATPERCPECGAAPVARGSTSTTTARS